MIDLEAEYPHQQHDRQRGEQRPAELRPHRVVEAWTLVDVLEMVPCTEEPCQTYVPSGSYRYTVEVPLGQFDDLDESAVLTIKG